MFGTDKLILQEEKVLSCIFFTKQNIFLDDVSTLLIAICENNLGIYAEIL